MHRASINVIRIMGNITKDPIVSDREFNGKIILKFSVATSHSKKSGDGWEDVTTYHNVAYFCKPDSKIVQNLSKGSKVMVMGRQENRSVKNDDGTWSNFNSILAQELTHFPGNKKRKEVETVNAVEFEDDSPF